MCIYQHGIFIVVWLSERHRKTIFTMSTNDFSIRRRRRQNLFTNDVRNLLHALGDVQNPNSETVAALEDVLTMYIVDMCHEAARVAHTSNRQKIKVEDFRFVLRRDGRKLGRVDQLLQLQKDIERSKRMFDTTEGKAIKNLVSDDGDKREKDSKENGKKSKK